MKNEIKTKIFSIYSTSPSLKKDFRTKYIEEEVNKFMESVDVINVLKYFDEKGIMGSYHITVDYYEKQNKD